MSLADIKARAAAATPGPWGWTGNMKNRSIELSTLHSGRLGVMRFIRWGMDNAQPIFLDPATVKPGTMLGSTTQKASDLPIFEVCRDATSADDPRVYRTDIVGIRHPDATFIAHARTDIDRLLAVAEAATAVLEDAKEMRAIVEELATLLGRPDLAARDAKPDAPLRRLRAALAALDAL